MDIIFAGRLIELDGGVFALLARRGWRESGRAARGMESPQGNNRCELLTGAAVRALRVTPTGEINRPAAIASEKGQTNTLEPFANWRNRYVYGL